MNAALSAVQQRNLQAAWSVPVVDRSGLIIDIFAQRALSKEASLQVSACWPLAPTSSRLATLQSLLCIDEGASRHV